jgi:SAM-dependent methyltransferase
VQHLAKTSSILELGCGPGYMIEFMKSEGFVNMKGIDLSEEQVSLARERGLNVQVTDALSYLPQTSEMYDAILAIDFLEHFSKEELLILISLIKTRLNPGGTLILQTPNGQGLFPNQIIYGDLTHMTILSPSSLHQLLSLFGFVEIDFQETGPAPKNLTGILRLILWRFVRLLATVVRMAETGKKQTIWTENMICCARRDRLVEA